MTNSTLEKSMDILKGLSNQVPNINPFLYAVDSYKVSHIQYETEGVQEIYSNITPRFDKYIKELIGESYDGNYVVFGVQWMLLRLQAMAQSGFFDRSKEEVIAEMREVHGDYIGNTRFSQFEELHDLGYLPVVVKALPEGTVVPVGVPFLTVRNTLPAFEWLPNYIETIFSTDLWKEITVATIARCLRLQTNKFALETTGSLDGTEWQNHDFHVRGGSGLESSAINGAAWLTSSCGTDNIPALWACNKFYQSTNKDGLLAGSVAAGEHSVTTSGILTEQERALRSEEEIDLNEAEYRYTRKLLTNRFPTGIFSYVADSFDFWNFVSTILPRLRNEIMSRDGKFVVRGDSGNPVHIVAGYRIKELGEDKRQSIDIAVAFNQGYEVVKIDDKYFKPLLEGGSVTGTIEISKYEAVGTIEALWEIFGGEYNDLGYKVLDSHIGMIYGDGINVQRSFEILTRLKEKQFASTNIVFGVGSYLLNLIGRDHLGMAIKATNTIVDIHGELVDKPIYKEPKTDSSKKSARGLISIQKNEDGEIYMLDMQTRQEEETGLLEVVYSNSQFKKLTTIFDIRKNIWG